MKNSGQKFQRERNNFKKRNTNSKTKRKFKTEGNNLKKWKKFSTRWGVLKSENTFKILKTNQNTKYFRDEIKNSEMRKTISKWEQDFQNERNIPEMWEQF